MKRKDLLKIIGICFMVFVVLSWIIPAGAYSNGTFTKGEVNPIGVYDIVRLAIGAVGNYAIYGIIFLLIGGLYSVMNKTGVYSNVVEGITGKFEKKSRNFLILSIIVFALLGSLSGFNIALFILVPLFIAVIMNLGYDKFTALISTVGAIIIGNIGSIYGFEISGYLNLYYGLDMNANMATKIIFLAILILLTILFVVKKADVNKVVKKKEKATTKAAAKKDPKVKVTKKTTKKETKTSTKRGTKKKEEKVVEVKETKETVKDSKKDIPLYDGNVSKSKKSAAPLVILFVLAFVILIVGLYNFQYAFNVSLFNDVYTSVTSFKIAGYPLFKYLLGSMNPFGSWNLGEIAFILVVSSFLIGWIYNLKVKETWSSMKDGMKKMVPVAIVVIFANIIMYLVIPSSSTGMHSNIYVTMNNWLLGLTKHFNWFTTGLGAFLGSFFYNDFKYLVDCTAQVTTASQTNASLYPSITLLFQALHGVVMLVAPVSVILMAGLAYLDISLKEWIKYIWKFLFELLIVIFIIVAITIAFV